MDFGEKPEGEAIDHNWQQISKRVFQGDRSQKLDRFAPSGKQRSWFWRNIGSKIDPKASEEEGMRNFPMMFKKVTPRRAAKNAGCLQERQEESAAAVPGLLPGQGECAV